MANITISLLDYEVNLSKKYQNLKALPGFVLLESTDQVHGRYDILSAFPYERLVVDSDSIDDDLFARLRQELKGKESTLDLPFQGGAIGYFSYDYACRLAKIPLADQLSSLPLVHLGFYDWAIITDHHSKKVSLFAANTRLETREIIEHVVELWHQTPDEASCQLENDFQPLIDKDSYCQSIDQIHHALKEGRCYQVNFTQPFKACYDGDNWALYEKLRHSNPVPYAAYLHYEQADVLSFSPERFVTQEEGHVTTSPIKGSIRRHQDKTVDDALKQQLFHCEKNRAENVMIVDLLRNDLGKIATSGSVIVEKLWAVESYQAIHHLVSTISAKTLAHPVDVFKACFPGGSITGAPKLESMRVIAEQEKFARGIYCGNIVYFSHHGRFDSNIAIRTLIAEKNQWVLAAGGGIVIDSDAEEEYQECLTKMSAILRGLSS